MEPIRIEITILKPLQKVWDYMNDPRHITKWNFADQSWHCVKAENDLRVGGMLKTRMEARDKSYGFDYVGIYDEIIPKQFIKYHLQDGRKVEIQFIEIDPNTTTVIETFEPETQNSRKMQREGWYAILNNFHKYVENN
ncbi:activator of HSP90 ATPase [Chryseobacterium sp. 6424]|uniref:SRPBCC domain-containing protein n=1 Tax=Chryseobacterium sp. 6424 TaxID=2039166 RepID=UPI000EFD9EB0|nr:SRPBCC domain-containing protein [Chryseobacterium sp. 6424]AYO58894.1 activator of HSP90 ATPase [Chryseobacterium sp. 6424]